MKFKSIKKVQDGNFIARYDVDYQTRDGQDKVYEMISRNRHMKDFADLTDTRPQAVVLIVQNEQGDKLLLNKEFRMAAGRWVYNFPAGLIELGESPDQAAVRELREETGLTLYQVDDTLGDSYSAIGFSNEVNVCVFGRARGTILPSDSVFEEIEAGWFDRSQVRELLRTAPFAARTQAYCCLWSGLLKGEDHV